MPPPKQAAADRRPKVPDRHLGVLKTGVTWEHLLQEMGCGSGMPQHRAVHSAGRPLDEGLRPSVGDRLHEVPLAERNAEDKIDGDRAAIDCSVVWALSWERQDRPESPNRAETAGPPCLLMSTGFRCRRASQRPTGTMCPS